MKKEKILIVTPFRNENKSIDKYMTALQSITYPKKLLRIFWIENDSSDNTYALLKQHQESVGATLKRVSILGAVKKQTEGEYWKDIPYGAERVQPWLTLWNEHIQPFINEQKDIDYVLVWFADCISPKDVMEKYLNVFETQDNIGWVGGVMFRRHPKHQGLCSPFPNFIEPPNTLIELTNGEITAHCWMMPYKNLTGFTLKGASDVFMTMAEYIRNQGLKIYCEPGVYLKHISTNGKIYSNSWFPEEGEEF